MAKQVCTKTRPLPSPRYHQILDCLDAHGLVPNATLWHFTHPTWFDDKGGFTKEANIPDFVRYSCKCFEWFGPRIKLWATFNEPTVRRCPAACRAKRVPN